jgi:hypothetical protein
MKYCGGASPGVSTSVSAPRAKPFHVLHSSSRIVGIATVCRTELQHTTVEHRGVLQAKDVCSKTGRVVRPVTANTLRPTRPCTILTRMYFQPKTVLFKRRADSSVPIQPAGCTETRRRTIYHGLFPVPELVQNRYCYVTMRQFWAS